MKKESYNDFGWVSTDGTYYKCKSWEHKRFAEDVLHKDEFDLEKAGWIKVTVGFPTGRGVYCKHMYITQQQHDTLIAHGFEESDLEDECIFVME